MLYIYIIIDFIRRALNKIFIQPGLIAGMNKCGKNVKIGAGCELKPLCNISLGDRVEIGPRALFWTTRAKINIGSDVIMGPGVTIITGDHPTNIQGCKINSIKDEDKPVECDQDVIIEDDVWIGCNVTILKGVHIHSGAIIAAGSTVTRNVEMNCIYGGVPAKKIKNRFENYK